MLHMMYLYAVRSSDQQSLRNLESRCYEIARAKIYEGMKHGDRPLDVLRAMILMTGYLFGKEWYNLGYNYIGQVVR